LSRTLIIWLDQGREQGKAGRGDFWMDARLRRHERWTKIW